MAARVWNVTQQRWNELPGEVNKGDVIQRGIDDPTPMHWVKDAFNADGSLRYRGHWAKYATIEQILRGEGKGGLMTDIHREGEMEVYCIFYDGAIYLILPSIIQCPAASFCNKKHSKCSISCNNNVVNLRTYYPGNAIFDPNRNPNNPFSCDIVIPNEDNGEAFGFEIRNKSEVKEPKWLSGMPMIEFDCKSQEQLERIKNLRKIDLKDPTILAICHPYNIGMLPCFREHFPCSFETISKWISEAQSAYVNKQKKRNLNINNNDPVPFTGYEPWDKWMWNYPKGRKGQLIEKVLREEDRTSMDWLHSESDYYSPEIILSRRTRTRFGLNKISKAEKEIDENFLNYLYRSCHK